MRPRLPPQRAAPPPAPPAPAAAPSTAPRPPPRPAPRRFVARKRIGVDEECYMPCDCEHEERGKSWRIEITVYVCEFDRPEPPRPPKCIFCPGDWNW